MTDRPPHAAKIPFSDQTSRSKRLASQISKLGKKHSKQKIKTKKIRSLKSFSPRRLADFQPSIHCRSSSKSSLMAALSVSTSIQLKTSFFSLDPAPKNSDPVQPRSSSFLPLLRLHRASFSFGLAAAGALHHPCRLHRLLTSLFVNLIIVHYHLQLDCSNISRNLHLFLSFPTPIQLVSFFLSWAAARKRTQHSTLSSPIFFLSIFNSNKTSRRRPSSLYHHPPLKSPRSSSFSLTADCSSKDLLSHSVPHQ